MNMQKGSKEAGFTLIELCIVLVITSLMLVGAIQAYTIYDEKQKIERSNSLMVDIDQSFSNFPDRYLPSSIAADAQGRLTGTYYARLPRPAPLNSASAGNDYDAEVASGDVNAAVASGNLIRVAGTGGVSVLIGKFPAGTLEIRNDYMKDIHGNYLLYAVTEAATIDLKSAGAITVIEEGIDHRDTGPTQGQLIEYETHPNVQYAVISMGVNGDGAYAFDGTRQFYNHASNACPSDAVKEGENCNLDDATFRVSLLSERDDNTTNNNYYDDNVIFKNSFTNNTSSAFDNVLSPAVAGEHYELVGNYNGSYTLYRIKDKSYANYSYTVNDSGGYTSGTTVGLFSLEEGEILRVNSAGSGAGNVNSTISLTNEDSGEVIDLEDRRAEENFIFTQNQNGSAAIAPTGSHGWGGPDGGNSNVTFSLHQEGFGN